MDLLERAARIDLMDRDLTCAELEMTEYVNYK